MSQLASEELQVDHNEESSSHDCRLDAKFLLSALSDCPIDLEIRNDESSPSSGCVKPRCHLSRSLRVRIQSITIDGCCGDNCGEVMNTPANSEDVVRPVLG